MSAGDGKVAVPGKSPTVRPSLWSKDGTDGPGAVPSVLEKSRMAHRPRPSDGTVDITGLEPDRMLNKLQRVLKWTVLASSS